MSAAEPQAARASDAWIALALGAGFLVLYLRTLCPTVYLGDSGEICTAIATGGIIHPPGFPLYALLGRAALLLVPVGEPAFRIGCVTALCGAAALAAFFRVCRELGCSGWASCGAAVLLGLSYTYWNESTRVEVYTLHLLLLCLALWGVLRYRNTGCLRALMEASLAVSLALANHLTIVLFGPSLLLLCGRRLWTDPGRMRRLLLAVAPLAVGPLLYLLLLLWTRARPLHAWGYPETLSLLWNHASARFYQGHLRLPDGAHLTNEVRRAGGLFLDTFPYLLILLPLVGGWLLWRRDRGVTSPLLLAVVVVGLYNLCYRIYELAPYYLPAWIVAAALLAVALDRALLYAGSRRLLAGGLLLAMLAGVPLARNWRRCDLSGATWVRDFTRHKLEHADPGSVLLTQGDQDTFPIWYVHDVLGVRPDVLPLDRAMVGGTWANLDRDPSLWYLRRLQHLGVNAPLDLPASPTERAEWASDGYLIRLLTGELRGRPLCATFAANTTDPADRQVFFRWAAPRYHLLPLGVDIRFHPRSRKVDLAQVLEDNRQRWETTALPDLSRAETAQELNPDYVRSHYATSLTNFGYLCEVAKQPQAAEAIYRRVVDWAPDHRPAVESLAALRKKQAAPPGGTP